MTNFVSLFDIAEQVGVEVSTVRRAVKQVGDELGITLSRQKSQKGGWAQCLNTNDTEKLITYLEARKKPELQNSDDLSFQRYGYFYIIQLVPEALPNRVKIGYTDNMEQRLSEHRTAAPTAKLLKSWPCKRAWDQAVMDSITRSDCELVLNEVYEGDVEKFLERANNFFAVMPSEKANKTLSEHSPLRKDVNNA